MKTTFSFKHKVLDVYESSLSHCVDEVPANPASAYPPSFVRLAQKTGNQPTNMSTNYYSLINYKTL